MRLERGVVVGTQMTFLRTPAFTCLACNVTRLRKPSSFEWNWGLLHPSAQLMTALLGKEQLGHFGSILHSWLLSHVISRANSYVCFLTRKSCNSNVVGRILAGRACRPHANHVPRGRTSKEKLLAQKQHCGKRQAISSTCLK